MDFILIGFSRPKNKLFPLFSWLIRLVDGTPYSHVYLAWDSTSIERKIVYEAASTTVHFIGSKRFYDRVEVVKEYRVPCTREQKLQIMQFAVDNCEVPYGIKQILGIGLARLLSVFGIRLKKNPFSNGLNESVCSEIGAYAMKTLGADIETNIDLISPKEVEDAVVKLPDSQLIINL